MASVSIGVSLAPRYDVLGYQSCVEADVIRRAVSPSGPLRRAATFQGREKPRLYFAASRM